MRIYLLALLVIISIPTAAFSFYKPSRIVAPEVFGMHCLKGSICVEDLATINIASDLVLTSVDEMQKDYSLVINAPRIVFCSTEKCTNRFGLGRRAAITIGTFGIVMSPRGWKPHYVKHELIHHWQASTFGSLAMLTGEKWIIEGMAYGLSDDPREHLSEPFESYRLKFLNWYESLPSESLEQSIRREL